MRNLNHKWRWLFGVLAALVVAVLLASCTPGGNESPAQRETNSRNGTYRDLVASSPAHTMKVSPSRDTINAWIDKWGQHKGKLSFVYLQSADGKVLGYYVLKGLPVSYCAALTPPYDIKEPKGDGDGVVVVPAPGVDGVFYSGGQCNTYYGIDATTGQYMEWTAGLGINTLLFEEPMPNQAEAQAYGPTTAEEGAKLTKK